MTDATDRAVPDAGAAPHVGAPGPGPGGVGPRLRDALGLLLPAAPDTTQADPLIEAVRAAALLGWLSILAVLVGLAVGLPVAHDEVVLATTLVAAVGHGGLGLLPWARLLPTARGRMLLNAWSAALIAGVCGLVLTAGGASRLDLLFFLVVPFLAIVHRGRPLALWLLAAAAAYVAATLLGTDPLPSSELVLHLLLLVGSGALGLQLAGAIRRRAEAGVEAVRRAELEGAMLAEGHHRVKNSLQVVADLLLLGRPESDGGVPGADRGRGTSGAGDAGSGVAGPAADPGLAFDHAAARIRSIAAVHDVLAERRGGRVPADELLRAVIDAAHPGATTLRADPVALPFSRAQNLGVVVNELVTNAHEHGDGPVAVRLIHDRVAGAATLEVSDAGPGPSPEAWAAPGLGLRLVRQVVGSGLRGSIDRVPRAERPRAPGASGDGPREPRAGVPAPAGAPADEDGATDGPPGPPGRDAGAIVVRFSTDDDAHPGR